MAEPIDLNQRTVFVLGAGASKPYGFPLGSELKNILITNLSNRYCQNVLKEHGFEESLVEDFAETLPRTYYPTIDIFLEKKTKFRELGAYLIAYSLLPMENAHNLFPQKDWYAHIYHMIDFENSKPDIENIAFISLNYDRSLEHFLCMNIRYNCPDHLLNNAESKLESLRIIHAHGSLGAYPEITFGNLPNDEEVLRRSAEGIRIVSDTLEDSDDFRAAQELIRGSSNLLFIGFGYDSTTLSLLMRDVDLSKKRILGTGYGLNDARIKEVIQFFDSRIFLTSSNTNAVTFVSDFLPLKHKFY